jgi:hypothetical protein
VSLGIRSLLLLLAFVCGRAVVAQEGVRFTHPEKYERATKTDDKGLVQWAEHKPPKCQTCSGTGKTKCTTCERFPEEATKCPDCKRDEAKESVCMACAGTGEFPDPLVKAPCPGCYMSGRIVCASCPGSGALKLGDDKRWSNCIGCRGAGWTKCGVCDGKRLVDTAAVKPSLKDANAAALSKAMATTDEALKAMTAFGQPKGDKTRKDVKELARILLIAQGVYPPLKKAPKVLDDLMATAYAASGYQGQAEREVHALMRVKESADYFLKHQRRMLELALKRAEANEKLLAEQKGK